MVTVTTCSADETYKLGRLLAERISSKAVFLLQGDLGSGKTTFAKGVAAGLGIDPDDIHSPTFTLVSEHTGRMKMVHVDLYRIDDPLEMVEHLGLTETLDEIAVVVIEWAEKLQGFTIETGFQVSLHWIDDLTRTITVEPLGDAALPPELDRLDGSGGTLEEAGR